MRLIFTIVLLVFITGCSNLDTGKCIVDASNVNHIPHGTSTKKHLIKNTLI